MNNTAERLMKHLESQIAECKEKQREIVDRIGEVGYLTMLSTLVEIKVDFDRIYLAN